MESIDIFRDVSVDDEYYDDTMTNEVDEFERIFPEQVSEARGGLDLHRTDVDAIQRQVVFVDPQSREVIKTLGGDASLKQVRVITRNIGITESDLNNLIIAKSTVEVILPKISPDTKRQVNDTHVANTVRITSVIPTVSNIARAAAGDKFMSGSSSMRISGGTTKNFYGINGVWYDA